MKQALTDALVAFIMELGQAERKAIFLALASEMKSTDGYRCLEASEQIRNRVVEESKSLPDKEANVAVERACAVLVARQMAKTRDDVSSFGYRLGISPATLRRWSWAYEHGGISALVPRKSTGRPRKDDTTHV